MPFKIPHLACILVVVAAYFLGVYYPSVGQGVVSKAKSVTGQ